MCSHAKTLLRFQDCKQKDCCLSGIQLWTIVPAYSLLLRDVNSRGVWNLNHVNTAKEIRNQHLQNRKKSAIKLFQTQQIVKHMFIDFESHIMWTF